MYPVPPVTNIATLLRSFPFSGFHRPQLEVASCAGHALPAGGLRSKDMSSAAVPEYEYLSNTPTSRESACHKQTERALRDKEHRKVSRYCRRQSRVRLAE